MTELTTNGQEAETAPLLELFMEMDKGGQTAAYLGVRWRPTSQLIDRIKIRQFKDPHIMLTVRSVLTTPAHGHLVTERKDTAHVVVPLTQEMVFIWFTQPGINEVIATVVDVNNSNTAKQLRQWASEPGAEYHYSNGYSLFDEEGNTGGTIRIPFIATGCLVEVVVPSEMFAKPRTGWKGWLVGKFFDRKPRDECHFRRQLGWSLLGAVLSLAIWPLRLALFLFTLLVGIRQINWKGLHPFEWSDDGWPVKRYENITTIWWHNRKGQKRPNYVRMLEGFLAVTLIGPIVYWFISDMEWWPAVVQFYKDIGIGALIGGAVFGIIFLVIKSLKRVPRKTEAELAAQEYARLIAELAAMALTTSPVPRIEDLREDKQTFWLRLSAVKARFCKPFAGSR